MTTPLEAVTRAVRPVTARSDALNARTPVRPGARRPHADRAETRGSPDDPPVLAQQNAPLGATTVTTATSAATGANDVPARAAPVEVAVRPHDPAAVTNVRTPLGALKRAAAVRAAPATREVRARVILAVEALVSTKTVNDGPAPRREADDQVSRADARVSTKPAPSVPLLRVTRDRVTRADARMGTRRANDDPAPRREGDDQVSRADVRVSTKRANDDPLLALAALGRADPAAQVRATISPDVRRRNSIGDRRAS